MAEKTDYVVLKDSDGKPETISKALENGARVWIELESSVAADKNTEAITIATKAFSEEGKKGNYAAPSVRNFPIIPRMIRTEVVDEFGAPSTTGSRPRKPAPLTPSGQGGDGGED